MQSWQASPPLTRKRICTALGPNGWAGRQQAFWSPCLHATSNNKASAELPPHKGRKTYYYLKYHSSQNDNSFFSLVYAVLGQNSRLYRIGVCFFSPYCFMRWVINAKLCFSPGRLRPFPGAPGPAVTRRPLRGPWEIPFALPGFMEALQPRDKGWEWWAASRGVWRAWSFFTKYLRIY